MHGLPWRKFFRECGCRHALEFRRISRDETESARRVARSCFSQSWRSAARRFRQMACGIGRVRKICEPRRFTRRGGNMWRRWMPRERNARCFHQHDDAHWPFVGSSALQQRRDPNKKCPFWRKLRSRRQAAIHPDVSSANVRRDAQERRSAGTHTTLSLGNFAAWQCTSRIRTRWREKSRTWESNAQRATRKT